MVTVLLRVMHLSRSTLYPDDKDLEYLTEVTDRLAYMLREKLYLEWYIGEGDQNAIKIHRKRMTSICEAWRVGDMQVRKTVMELGPEGFPGGRPLFWGREDKPPEP